MSDVSEQTDTSRWSEFVRALIGDRTSKEVADKVGVSDSTVGNWRRGERFKKPDADMVVKFVREYRPNALQEGMVAAGYGTADEYSGTVTAKPPEVHAMELRELIQLQAEIIEELQKRLDTMPKAPAKAKRTRLRDAPVIPGSPPLGTDRRR